MLNLINEIKNKIGKKRLFYVCRDAERSVGGLQLRLPNFFVATNDSSYARELKKQYNDKIILVKAIKPLDTHELLTQTKQIQKNDRILVFKPTAQIEKICAKYGWLSLNPSANLAEQVEQKISQVKWLGNLKKYLPKYKIDTLQNIKWSGRPFMLQFAHGHTGSGTALMKTKKQLDELKKKFPERPARVTKYIRGPLFTNNNIVWGNKILIGNISYQITGLKPFTNREFATVGNDWELPGKIFTSAQIKQYQKIATDVGKKLARANWKGLYGVDIVMEEKTGKLFLLEINARQPASTTYESELQLINNEQSTINKRGVTTLAAHLAALLKIPYSGEKLIDITTGAQIIKRVGADGKKIKGAWRVIKYENTAIDSDQIRYQFLQGIMSKHNQIKI